jgi:hypothetical protein
MRAAAGALLIVGSLAVSCGGPPPTLLRLDGNLLTVDNRTDTSWNHVEIWLNQVYRVTTPSIPAGGRFQAPLDTFVESRGGRFRFASMQVHDLRLMATRPDGSTVDIRKAFEGTGLGRLKEQP